MESEGSTLHSQQPATCPYPQPDQSSPCTHSTSWRSIWILSSHLTSGFSKWSRSLAFPNQNYMNLSFPHTCYRHRHSHSSLSDTGVILGEEYNNEAPHSNSYSVVSSSPSLAQVCSSALKSYYPARKMSNRHLQIRLPHLSNIHSECVVSIWRQARGSPGEVLTSVCMIVPDSHFVPSKQQVAQQQPSPSEHTRAMWRELVGGAHN